MARHRTRLHVVLLASLLLLASEVGDASAAPERALSVRVHPLGASPIEGTLRALGPEGLVVGTATGDRRVSLAKLRALDVVSPPASRVGATPHLRVALTTGEVLVGAFGGEIGDGMRLETTELGSLPLLFDVVQTVVPVPAKAGLCYEPEHRYRAGEEDTAYSRSGDAYGGILLSTTEEGIEVETERGNRRALEWSDLLVLHLENEPPDIPEGLCIEVETVDGARLRTARPPRIEGTDIVVSPFALADDVVRVPLTRLRALRTSGGAFVYASDLPFESTFTPFYRDDPQETGFIARWFATRADRRPTGCPLRLGGRTFRHGFAVHARSSIRLSLGRGYTIFETLFGVDDEALDRPRGGVVDARIVGDGKVLWQAEDVRAGDAPRRVGPLDVGAVDELVLEVDFGAELHVRDRATWADPVLHKR